MSHIERIWEFVEKFHFLNTVHLTVMVTFMINECLMYIMVTCMCIPYVYNTTVIMNSDTHLTGYLYAIEYVRKVSC